MSNSHPAPAFTVIELAITLAIAALVATITIPSWLYLHRSVVRLELGRLYQAIHYTRQLALTTNQPQTMQFNLAQHSYHYGQYTTSLNQSTKFGTRPHSFGPPAEPKTLITQPVTFAGGQLVAEPTGVLTPGTIYLTDLSYSQTYALTVPISQALLLREYRQAGAHWERL